jgi:hypothetical protein
MVVTWPNDGIKSLFAVLNIGSAVGSSVVSNSVMIIGKASTASRISATARGMVGRRLLWKNVLASADRTNRSRRSLRAWNSVPAPANLIAELASRKGKGYLETAWAVRPA